MTDPWLTFYPVISLPVSVGLLFVLAVFILWLEWKRNTSFRALRLLVAILLVISLGGLILRPSYKTEKFNATVLLTQGYNPVKVDSIQKLYPGIRVLHAPGTKQYKNATPLTSWHELSAIARDINFVIGYGLSTAALELLQQGSFQFLPSYSTGITQLMVSEPVFPNRKTTIEGVINTTDPGTKLYLEGPGGKEDSVLINKTGSNNFHLNFIAKEPGNFLYTLRSNKGIKEVLPVQVGEHPVSDVLFLQNYPTFESRGLKNFLSKQHRLLFRYHLSKNTFRYEYINRRQRPIAKLTEAVLSTFDLLVVDSDTWQSLSGEEVRNVQQAVRNGLGILLLFNEDPASIKGLRNFLPVKFTKIPSDTAQFRIDSRNTTLPAWSVTPLSEKPIVPIFENKSRVLSGYCANGLGKTAFQLLQETYRLSLQGDSVTYNTLWSQIIERTSRTAKNTFTLRLSPGPWFPDEPITAEIISSGTEPELMEGETHIPLMEDPLIDDIWRGKIWTGQPGWHSLSLKNDSTKLEYFVSEKDTWTSLASANAARNTSLYAGSTNVIKNYSDHSEPVPPWAFYILFIISAGILWIIPKF